MIAVLVAFVPSLVALLLLSRYVRQLSDRLALLERDLGRALISQGQVSRDLEGLVKRSMAHDEKWRPGSIIIAERAADEGATGESIADYALGKRPASDYRAATTVDCAPPDFSDDETS